MNFAKIVVQAYICDTILEQFVLSLSKEYVSKIEFSLKFVI